MKLPPMSPKKRVGRVQLGIRRAFIVAPDREWTTRQLMELTTPCRCTGEGALIASVTTTVGRLGELLIGLRCGLAGAGLMACCGD